MTRLTKPLTLTALRDAVVRPAMRTAYEDVALVMNAG